MGFAGGEQHGCITKLAEESGSRPPLSHGRHDHVSAVHAFDRPGNNDTKRKIPIQKIQSYTQTLVT
jgi:hypothetical protein